MKGVCSLSGGSDDMVTHSFRDQFPFVSDVQEQWKIIVGQRPYMQRVGDIELEVSSCSSSVEVYRQIGHIPFLVSEWIKVPDSLEMLFNVLFGYERSLHALAVLRSEHISPVDFADFLWLEANVALFNMYGHDGATNKSVISEHMQATARYSPGHVHVLLVGKAAARAFPKRAADITYVEAIHPSGVNLLNCDLRERYYNDWILCETMENFRVFWKP